MQRWAHDLERFRRHSRDERDAIIGRRLSDNEEIEDAPESAHVKRTAQELFDPTAFMVRRSHPWASNEAQGLEFIAFAGESRPVRAGAAAYGGSRRRDFRRAVQILPAAERRLLLVSAGQERQLDLSLLDL